MITRFWLIALALFVWTFADTFRRRDLSGWSKAGWGLLLFVFPLFGPLIYIAVRPRYATTEVVMEWAPLSGSRMSAADELAYAHGLLAQGTITEGEFEEIKRNVVP